MKILEVNKSDFSVSHPSLYEISDKLDSLTGNTIETINWEEFPYKPSVSFAITYTDHEILLKFYITEQYFKAEKTISNQKVNEDSCVELFLSPFADRIYYNLEFNAIGTCLAAAGTDRNSRVTADPSAIAGIRRLPTMGNKPIREQKGDCSWSLTVALPFEIFFLHRINDLKGSSLRANFYKSGDKLSEPHYLTWSPVSSEKPDFHRPEYFGILKFVCG